MLNDEPLSATFYKTAAAGAPADYQLISLSDIEKISNNIVLPSLENTRTSSFDRNKNEKK